MKILFLLLFASAAHASPIAVEDFMGRTVTLNAPAQRIIALAPHIVENLFSAGAGEKIVGVVSFSNYPEQAQNIPEVGSYNAYSLETIVSLKPDIIVMWGSGNGMAALEKFERLGIPVFVSEPKLLSDIPKTIRLLAMLAGTLETGELEAQRIEFETEQLATQFRDTAEISVFYQIWNDPLQTLSGDHLINQVITLCGGRNVFFDAKTLAPRISIESVLLRNPDSIVASGMSQVRPEWLDEWLDYPSLNAVKNVALFSVDPDHIQRPTARVLLGAKSLCGDLASIR
ncbi:MAG: iron complex transport system substrate-binding protein [Halioglobus sp.]|jgi:iron complex transport system substrate-binding protein